MPFFLGAPIGSPTVSIEPYSEPDPGTLLTRIVTVRRPPAGRVNARASTASRDSSVLWRFGATAPLRACVHGRGVTVTLSGLVVLLTTVIGALSPRAAVCSMTAGVTDRPPPASAPARQELSTTA